MTAAQEARGLRVVVVGATGNIGTAVLRALEAAADVDAIVGVARRLPDPSRDPYGAASWVACDVSASEASAQLAEAFAGADAVVHLAWLLQPSRDEEAMRRTNVEGTKHVVEAALAAGVGHFVFASSVGVYSPGPKDREVDESWPRMGIRTSSYSRDKAEVEAYLDTVEERHPELTITRLRQGLAFQREAADEIARYFLGPLVPVRVIGRVPLPVLPLSQEMVFQVVHTDDLAQMYVLVLRERAGGAYNVAADPVLGPSDLGAAVRASRVVTVPIRVFRALAAVTWRLHLQPSSPGWVDLARDSPIMSTTRARGLGWEPTISSSDALAELIAGFTDRASGSSPVLCGRTRDRSR